MTASKTITLMAVALGICGFAAAPVLADLSLNFNMDNQQFQYTKTDSTHGTMDIFQLPGTSVTLTKLDGENAIDTNFINNGTLPHVFVFDINLAMTKTAGLWSGLGTLSFSDTATGSPAVYGNLKVTPDLIEVLQVGNKWELTISGTLSPAAGNTSILVNRPPSGSSWTFTGEGSNDHSINEDGNFDTVTVANKLADWVNGGIVYAKIPIPVSIPSITDLDILFSSNRGENSDTAAWRNGVLSATVDTPVPAAVLLGMIGLGALGLVMRRYA